MQKLDLYYFMASPEIRIVVVYVDILNAEIQREEKHVHIKFSSHNDILYFLFLLAFQNPVEQQGKRSLLNALFLIIFTRDTY